MREKKRILTEKNRRLYPIHKSYCDYLRGISRQKFIRVSKAYKDSRGKRNKGNIIF